jgi:PadR family transcriptional regulator PadR
MGLGNLELVVLLIVMRLGDEAYGVPIAREVEHVTRRGSSLASVYAALERLEAKGLLTSKLGAPTAERGGRAKTYFRATSQGVSMARETRRTLAHLCDGVPELKLEAAK